MVKKTGKGFKCLPGHDDRVDVHGIYDYDLTEEITNPKKQGARLLQFVRRLFPKRRKGYSGKFSKKLKPNDDAGSVSFASTTDDIIDDDPLIQKRLLKTGLVKKDRDFEFVKDIVSKEVDPTSEDLKKAFDEENVSHVKTGVWEVSIVDEEGNSTGHPLYVVTGWDG